MKLRYLIIPLVVVSACNGGGAQSDSDSCADSGACAGVIETIAGTGFAATDSTDEDADGVIDSPIPALQANFDLPVDITVGPDGRLFIIDWNGHKIRVLNDDGNVDFVAGTGFEGDACEEANDDGTCPAVYAELNHMTDIAFDAEGRMVISAWHNSKIKRVDLTTELLEDLCGTGNRKFEGDDGPCESEGNDLVSFDLPSSVAYDSEGNLFIADQANQVVRRLGTDGIIKTVVGSCPGESGSFGCAEGQGYEGDEGPALSAKLNNTYGQGTDAEGKIAFGPDGSLYIADSENNAIRKVVAGSDGVIGEGNSDEEIITTVAGTNAVETNTVGTSEGGYSGDGGLATLAELNGPRDVEVAEDGIFFIADTLNNCIRSVDSLGVIRTVAGICGEEGGYAGDQGEATEALLNQPYGIELDDEGNLYIADTLNCRIRIVYGGINE